MLRCGTIICHIVKLKNDITAVRNVCNAADFLIVMSIPVADILSSTKELTRTFNVNNLKQGEINDSVLSVNGIPIIAVPSSRLKSAYTFNSGTTNFGFTPTADAKDINWIICPRTAPIAVSKTDGVKIFTPEQTQGADAWKIEYRKFHDLWVMDKQLTAMRASVSA